jgi:hypothetical protein
MSKDITNMIIEYIENDKLTDKLTDGLELKDMFRKKIKMDASDMKYRLKELVSNHIREHQQPIDSSLKLNSTKIRGGGSVIANDTLKANTRGTARENFLQNDIYTTTNESSYLTVTNMDSKSLILNAIIPLDLRWHIEWNNAAHTQIIVVSWSHWENE